GARELMKYLFEAATRKVMAASPEATIDQIEEDVDEYLAPMVATGKFPEIVDIERGQVEDILPEEDLMLVITRSWLKGVGEAPELRRFSLSRMQERGIRVKYSYFLLTTFSVGGGAYSAEAELVDADWVYAD
ncbi:MAG: hypothetical protein AAF804_22090, partial [Bacteroidota bacterium]